MWMLILMLLLMLMMRFGGWPMARCNGADNYDDGSGELGWVVFRRALILFMLRQSDVQ